MEQTSDKKGSLRKASKAEKQRQQEKEKSRNLLKKINHRVSWVVGIIFALIPIMACSLGMLLHSDNKDMMDNYVKFLKDFFSSGSFLWVFITVLVMSLIELLLCGFRKNLSDKERVGYNIFLIISIFFVVAGVCIYMNNIGTPIEGKGMYIISAILFILFAISSGIISFKMVQEV